jgi:O-antigen ligase
VAAALAALAAGVLVARHTSIGLAVAVAAVYVPLIFLNLPLALALWVPLTFMTSVHFPASAPAAISVLLLAAWIGTLRRSWRERLAVLENQRGLVVAIVMYLLWSALSLLWAENSLVGSETFVEWLIAGGVFLVIATTVLDARHARWIALAFVAGGVASVAIGIASAGGLHGVEEAGLYSSEGRLTGGSTDPNYLGAGLIASAVLAVALFASSRRLLLRWAMGGSVVILVAGIVASESRGAILSGVVAAVAALFIFRRQRGTLITVLVAIGVIGLLWFGLDPGALQRITHVSGTGTGRTDLWTVAWRIGRSHPLVGVGLGNFIIQEPHYVLRPGALSDVLLIVEQPHVAHNMYLQTFAELGIIGFVLLLGVVASLVVYGLRAARRFDAAGESSLATLTRGVVVAEIAVFTALVFLSDGPDERFWVLFGLGAALLGLASTSWKRIRPAALDTGSRRDVAARFS